MTENMADNPSSSILQTTSQVLLVGAGIVYVFGFVILSVFDSSYGIADFSLFRTKILSAGTVFAFMLTIPLIVTFRVFRYFGLNQDVQSPTPLLISEKNLGWHRVDVGLYLPFLFASIMFAMNFLFTFKSNPGGRRSLIIVGMFILLGLWAFAKTKIFDKHPISYVGVSALFTIALFVLVFKYEDIGYYWVLVWFSIVALIGLTFYSRLKSKEAALKTEWEQRRFSLTSDTNSVADHP